ncbi:FAD binding domain-containing protein [Sediminicoccus sp. KRV36]|uniref:FAD binding domain-containing protein n=1 Tax=Sediminicoccus sp. KRV36 TaxID=3133721 RepID=UPI00200C9DBB|nr:FAD binding domain-containing protein [Sediminicoccus rosea]UPY36753.1 FAD binding domain-containing protein [Sediminicoccus rosea]
MHDAIRFTLNQIPRELPRETLPTQTLLDWLRAQGMTGTKEGCAEGDCGACTVVLEAADSARTPINACLCTLGQLHGRAIRTVEGLGPDHPIPRAMAAADATQCGFCTPGIVMSAWAQASEGGEAHEALAGNLCRCTGYRPILDAMASLAEEEAVPPALPQSSSASFGGFHLPASLAEALALRAALPAAWLLMGGTDLGLRFAEHREHPAEVICLLSVTEMQGITRSATGLSIGAAAPYAELLAACRADVDFAPLAPYLARLGSRQIRGLGTVAGNLGTASPIGDALPILLALDAEVELAAPRAIRRLKVEDFITGYRRNALQPDELILAIHLPRPPAGALLAAEKLSRRHDQDISAVSLVACLSLRDGVVQDARLAFGGMAARAERAPAAEAALKGRTLDDAAMRAAGAALHFTPMSDARASAEYRLEAARGLLRRVALRHTHPHLAAEVHA